MNMYLILILIKSQNSCNPVFYRVEGGNGWSSDPVRSGLDVSGSGVLETPQHFTALQGLSSSSSI